MSQANKHLVADALRALAAGDIDTYVAVHHRDYVNHEAACQLRGADAARNTGNFLHRTFEDMRIEPLDLIAEDDLIAVRVQFSGRQVAALDGFAASGRECSVQHVHIYRVTDGQISEHWSCRDDLRAVRQMGLLPSSIEAPA